MWFQMKLRGPLFMEKERGPRWPVSNQGQTLASHLDSQ